MEYEWFLIGLAVVFLAGWFAGRLDIRQIRKAAGELPHAYLRGLSHLLRGEKNLALDCFLQAQPLAPESDELQFAIGELSRTRGEHRRALAVHLALCESETTSPQNRERARWELACDYLKMGFFDLAEKHAAPFADNPAYRERACAMLLDIRQRTGDYKGALDALLQMPTEDALIRRRTHAHLLCEIAVRAESSDQKRETLKDALKADGQCARAGIMLGDLAAAEGRHAQAAQHYAECEQQNAGYLWYAVSGFAAAMESQNKSQEGSETVLRWVQSHPSEPMFTEAYRQLAARGLARDLAKDGTKRGFEAAAAAWAGEQLRAQDGAQDEFWRALEKMLASAQWHCETCGYKTADFSWQCPNCLSWESFHHAHPHHK